MIDYTPQQTEAPTQFAREHDFLSVECEQTTPLDREHLLFANTPTKQNQSDLFKAETSLNTYMGKRHKGGSIDALPDDPQVWQYLHKWARRRWCSGLERTGLDRTAKRFDSLWNGDRSAEFRKRLLAQFHKDRFTEEYERFSDNRFDTMLQRDDKRKARKVARRKVVKRRRARTARTQSDSQRKASRWSTDPSVKGRAQQ